MANILAPFGFVYVGRLDGSPPNAGLQPRQIAYDNQTAIFYGDPVVSLDTGYIAQATAGTTQIAGIFVGCIYYNQQIQRLVNSPYWPGSAGTLAPAGSISALIVSDPFAVFLAQSNGSPITIADVNANINFAIGTGNTTTGISGASLNQSTIDPTVTTRPFRIIGPSTTMGNGGDETSNYNYALVTFNNQDFKTLTGQ